MFNQLVAIEPPRVDAKSEALLHTLAHNTKIYPDIPQDSQEIIQRIGDADGVLLSFTSAIDGQVLRACPNLRYVGMCCSLYSPESANVDIKTAQELGIHVAGVRDYGDQGVQEYVIGELSRFLHGFGGPMWQDEPMELTGLPIGIIGMGTTGTMLARMLGLFGAQVSYYSRTRKREVEEELGCPYLPLDDLLRQSLIVITCLNKNTTLLHRREFALLGDGKLLVNISISPGHDVGALSTWLDSPCQPGNFIFSDTMGGIDPTGALASHPHIFCGGKPAGMTTKAQERLGKKVISNIEAFFAAQG